MPHDLDGLAESHGIQIDYVSELGEEKTIPDEAKRGLLAALGVDADTGEKGAFESARQEPAATCPLPPAIAGRRHWGIACQLYALRSARSLGIGDYSDLADLARIAARAGASFVGVNPLHALFSADPGRNSPYSPSSRRFLNPLYIAPDRLQGGKEALAGVRAEQPDLFGSLGGDLVDHRAVSAAKHAILSRLFRDRRADIEDGQALERFVCEGGEALSRFALFEAISEARVADGGYAGWHHWPDELRDVASPAVAQFARDHADRVRYHAWLQFLAAEQLAEVQAEAKAAGMAIGLYLDLAVGVAPDGAETWMDPELTVTDARVGAPPDMFNSAGQDWGLAPLSPKVLAERGFRPLENSFETLTRHAGAVRIDHAMGLARLWWIPSNAEDSGGGGYVRYPLGEMVDAVAAAANKNRCLVIGEDLGTVPEGFRETMERARIFSYRVLFFERKDERFVAPGDYPHLSLACIGTHDLPTLAGWWEGADVDLREETGRQDAEATARDRDARAGDRDALLEALESEGIAVPREAASADGAELGDDLAAAVHRFGARTASLLFAVQFDDLVAGTRQANMPGTVDEYPNWRIRSAVALEDLADHPRFAAVTGALRQERPA